MEYYGCNAIDGLNLGVVGRFDLPVEEQKNLSLCCEPRKSRPGISLGKTPEETLERFLGMRHRLIVRGGESIPKDGDPCVPCPYYIKRDRGFSLQISSITFGMTPAPCQCHCFYCTQNQGIAEGWEKNPNVIEAYRRLFDFLNLARKENIITNNTSWTLASGEITVHPYKKQFMQVLKGGRVNFYTNCFIFDEDIARELHENPFAAMNLSMDSGTANTWRKVKGVDNFPQVIENLKQYSRAAHHPEQISLKYIIFPGINDSDEDFHAFVDFKKTWRMSLGTFSRDNRFFKNLNASNGDPGVNQVFDPKLIESAARLSAIHAKEIGPVSFSNFTEEEQRQVINRAQQILQSA